MKRKCKLMYQSADRVQQMKAVRVDDIGLSDDGGCEL